MSTGKVLTLAWMVALLLAPASFAGQPGFAGEKLNYVGDGYLPVDYNTAAEFQHSVPGEKLNYVGDGYLPVDYNTAAEFQLLDRR